MIHVGKNFLLNHFTSCWRWIERMLVPDTIFCSSEWKIVRVCKYGPQRDWSGPLRPISALRALPYCMHSMADVQNTCAEVTLQRHFCLKWIRKGWTDLEKQTNPVCCFKMFTDWFQAFFKCLHWFRIVSLFYFALSLLFGSVVLLWWSYVGGKKQYNICHHVYQPTSAFSVFLLSSWALLSYCRNSSKIT